MVGLGANVKPQQDLTFRLTAISPPGAPVMPRKAAAEAVSRAAPEGVSTQAPSW
jgi:hypothetical protein